MAKRKQNKNKKQQIKNKAKLSIVRHKKKHLKKQEDNQIQNNVENSQSEESETEDSTCVKIVKSFTSKKGKQKKLRLTKKEELKMKIKNLKNSENKKKKKKSQEKKKKDLEKVKYSKIKKEVSETKNLLFETLGAISNTEASKIITEILDAMEDEISNILQTSIEDDDASDDTKINLKNIWDGNYKKCQGTTSAGKDCSVDTNPNSKLNKGKNRWVSGSLRYGFK